MAKTIRDTAEETHLVPAEIKTARLRLRPLEAADTEELHRLWIDPDIRRYLWDDESVPIKRVIAIIEESSAQFQETGLGIWGVFLGSDDRLIGFCGYWPFREPPELQLLYGIAPELWGKGLATEAARAMIDHGIERGLKRIAASADAPNLASIRVMEKASMVHEKTVNHGAGDTVYYVVLRKGMEHEAGIERG